MASGVLVLLLGEATKMSAYIMRGRKTYRATLKLGAATDSLDAQGEVTGEAPVRAFERREVEAVLETFIGTHPQLLPAVSAVKRDGEPLYMRVRRGEVVDAPTRDATLYSASVLGVTSETVEIEIECESGFYVRSLGRDVANALGTLGHLTELRRLSSGGFSVDESFPGAALQARSLEGFEQYLHPLIAGARSLKRVVGTDEQVAAIRQGKRFPVDALSDASAIADGPCILCTSGERVVAIVEARDALVCVVRGFSDADAFVD